MNGHENGENGKHGSNGKSLPLADFPIATRERQVDADAPLELEDIGLEDEDSNSSLDSDEKRELKDVGISLLHKKTFDTEAPREGMEEVDGSYWTFTYLIWGVFIGLDCTLQVTNVIFGGSGELSAFAQSLCIALQCVFIAFFRPFDPPGVNYFALIAGFLQFLLGATSGFLALFTKYTGTEMGKSVRHYIPFLESLANTFTMGIMLWCFMLLFGKLATVFVETFEEQIEEVKEEIEEFIGEVKEEAHRATVVAVSSATHVAHGAAHRAHALDHALHKAATSANLTPRGGAAGSLLTPRNERGNAPAMLTPRGGVAPGRDEVLQPGGGFDRRFSGDTVQKW